MSVRGVNALEGTVEFVVKAGKFRYDDGQYHSLVELHPADGTVSLVKGLDNVLRLSHAIAGGSETMLEYDVASLGAEKSHMFAVTWSVKDKKLVLYIDGEAVKEEEIA